MKKLFAITLLTALCFSLTACGERENSSIAETDEKTATNETLPEVPEGAIVDESGTFVYTGPLRQGGDDENGYIKVPLSYVSFREEGVEGLTQFSNMAGTTVITLDRYEGYHYELIANNMRYYLSEDENVEGLTGAKVKINGYNSLQLYCHYKNDGKYLVAWAIEDPANTEDCYYLAIEFPEDDKSVVACSSTFQTIADYAKSQTASES